MIKAYVLINSETAYTYQVVEKIKGISGVVEIHEVLGPYDIVAEVEISFEPQVTPGVAYCLRNKPPRGKYSR